MKVMGDIRGISDIVITNKDLGNCSGSENTVWKVSITFRTFGGRRRR